MGEGWQRRGQWPQPLNKIKGITQPQRKINNMTEVMTASHLLFEFRTCSLLHFSCTQQLIIGVVEFLASVLPAGAPSPTAVEALRVTAGPAAEPIAACVNDCVLFRNAAPAHDPTGRSAALLQQCGERV